MSRKPIGDAPLSNAERCRRRREKAKVQAEANGSIRPSRRVMTNTSMGIPIDLDRVPPAAAVDLLAGGPEAIAARIFERVSVEMARGIAMALQQRLLLGGCWPTWRLPLM